MPENTIFCSFNKQLKICKLWHIFFSSSSTSSSSIFVFQFCFLFNLLKTVKTEKCSEINLIFGCNAHFFLVKQIIIVWTNKNETIKWVFMTISSTKKDRRRQRKKKKKKTILVFLFVFRFSFVHCIISHLFHIIWDQKRNSYLWFLGTFWILKVTHQMNWQWWARLKYYYESQSNRNFNGSIRISSWWMPFFFDDSISVFFKHTYLTMKHIFEIFFCDLFNAKLLNTLLFISWICWKIIIVKSNKMLWNKLCDNQKKRKNCSKKYQND